MIYSMMLLKNIFLFVRVGNITDILTEASCLALEEREASVTLEDLFGNWA